MVRQWSRPESTKTWEYFSYDQPHQGLKATDAYSTGINAYSQIKLRQTAEGSPGAGRMDNSSWSCIWSHYCRSRCGIKVTLSTYLIFFKSANFKASSPLSRCEKPATRNQSSVAAFFYHLHKLNLVLFPHLFSVQVQPTGSRQGNLMLPELSIFCHLAFFLRGEMGFILQPSFLVLLWENCRTRYISKYLSSLKFLEDRLSKWIKSETQDSDWETVAVKIAGISRLQIFKALGLGLHLSLLVISSLKNTFEIHLWV